MAMTNHTNSESDLYRIHHVTAPAGLSTPLQVTPLTGDASLRRYFRLDFANHSSLIATLLPQQESNSEVGATTSPGRFGEIATLFATHDIAVPKIICFDPQQRVYLQEDLGDLTLAAGFASMTKTERRALYGDAVQMAKRISTLAPATNTPVFDRQAIVDEFLHFHDEIMQPANASDKERALETWHALSLLLASGPYASAHRDFHARNLMVVNRTLVTIDFQDFFIAPAGYDLISLSRDAYMHFSEADREFLEQDWAHENTFPNPIVSAQQWLDLVGVQRNLKAAGRFAWFSRVRKDHSYMPDVPRLLWLATEALRRLPLSEGPWLAEWIQRYAPFPCTPDTESLLVQ